MRSLVLAALALAAPAASQDAPKLPPIRPAADGSGFVRGEGDAARPFVAWGVNYDRDDAGRLLEDYWADEWDTVAADFREIKALGANVVRVHLQVGRFLDAADRPNAANLGRLRELVRLAESVGLYLDITGLGCYHKADVPAWYDALGEADRWDAQANFWAAVAGACKGSPAVFCYDLMNEPIVSGGEGKDRWLPGEPLGGEYFVQRITLDVGDRTDREVARAWVGRLTSAIRAVDDRTMITVGVIPWAQTFPGARPLFYAPEVAGPLDFVSIHLYPRADKLDADLAAARAYEIGKPLVIEEIFPLGAGIDQTEAFLEKSRPFVDGYLSFYWGKTADEYDREGGLKGAIVGAWLRRFRALSDDMTGMPKNEDR
jgi:hypothetical protein